VIPSARTAALSGLAELGNLSLKKRVTEPLRSETEIRLMAQRYRNLIVSCESSGARHFTRTL